MGRPDVNGVTAQLVVKYSNVSEGEYEQLLDLRDALWMHIDLDVTKTRLYPPRQALDAE